MSKHPGNESHEGFVSRWSRRKSGARNSNTGNEPAVGSNDPQSAIAGSSLDHMLEPTQPETSQPTRELSQNALAPQRGPGESEPQTEAPLPPIESLTEDSDYSAFMAPNVSAELRTLALRKLFKSSVFHVRDGLDDYDEDFTTFEKLGDIITADMRHHAERKARLQDEDEARLAQEENGEPAPADATTQTAEQEGSDALTAQDDSAEDDKTSPTDQSAPMGEPARTNSSSADNTDAPATVGKLRRRPDKA